MTRFRWMAAAAALALWACGADAPDSGVEVLQFRAEKITVGDAESAVGEDIATIRARAESGDREAQFLLGFSLRTSEVLTDSASTEGLEWIQASADQGWADAQLFLGARYDFGECRLADKLETYRVVGPNGESLEACKEGGRMVTRRLVLLADDTRAIGWYSLAASQGHPLARLRLGEMYDSGEGVAEDDVAAVKWYRLAAEQGSDIAQYRLARMYGKGEGVSKDDVEALKWCRLSAEQGNAAAQAELGLIYDGGEGVAENDVEAFKWFRLAAEQGFVGAQYSLARMYGKGEGVAKDDVEAAKWFRLAAEQGYARAQFVLGAMYDDGRGVAENDAEAVKWYRLAAEQGDANAQYNLGVMYGNSEGVTENDVEAVKWYRLAAEQGNANAQYNLGVMYGNGEGAAQSNEEAYFWMSLAAASLDSKREVRDQVKALLTREQVERTQTRTAAWTPAATFEEAKERLAGALAADPKPERVRPAPAPAPTTVALSPSPSGPPIIKTSDRDSDIAVVTTSARLRASPGGEVLATIEAGAELALLGRAATDGWYEVIDIESGALGWIHESVLRLELAASPAPAAQIFQAQATGVDAPPEVKVENKANRTIWLRVGDQKYTIEAGQTLKVNVPAGSHRFNAWAAGVIPASGTESFNRGYTYNWAFWIKRR